MKKLLLILSILFSAAAILGACYVIYTGGQTNPGFCLICLVFGLSCLQGYRVMKNKEGEKK